jgi:teichoic acid transport system permease protein
MSRSAVAVEPAGDVPPGLVRLGVRTPLREYLRDLWRRRDYILYVSRSDMRAENLDSFLGNLWHALNPLLLMGVYYLIFGVILGTDRGLDNFITFLAVGIFTFQFTQKSIVRGTQAIVGNIGLLRSLQFPRAILPVSGTLTKLFEYGPATLVMLSIAVFTGEPPSLTWLWLVPICAVQIVFNLGLACAAARITDVFRDFENVLPFAMRITFYVSGILYSVDLRVESDSVRSLFALNPIYAVVTLARAAVFGDPQRATLWLSFGAWAVGALVVGFALFRSAETTYGRG